MTQKVKDPRGGHLRMYWEIYDSPAWRCLSSGEQRCYWGLLRNLRSTNNGDLSLALSVSRHHGIKSHTTLAAGLRALVAVGLIAITRKGGSNKGGQRLPTLYRLTDLECYEQKAKFIEACKATNEWRKVQSIGQGKSLIKAAHLAAKAEAAAKAAEAKAKGQRMQDTPEEEAREELAAALRCMGQGTPA